MNPEERIKEENELLRYDGPDKIVSFSEKMEQIKANPRNLKIFGSGLPTLDRKLEGFHGSELYIIAGLPGHGKSLLAQTFCSNFSKAGLASMWLSYELSYHELMYRFPDVPLAYIPDEMATNRMDWIRKRVLESKIKYNCQAVFIDHLHFLFDYAKTKNVSLEIGSLVRTLKSMTIEFNMTIFLLCHTTKIPKGENVSMSDIRDSGLIAGEADGVLMIKRRDTEKPWDPDAEDENRSALLIEKHRRTGVRGKTLSLVKANGFLEEEARL